MPTTIFAKKGHITYIFKKSTKPTSYKICQKELFISRSVGKTKMKSHQRELLQEREIVLHAFSCHFSELTWMIFSKDHNNLLLMLCDLYLKEEVSDFITHFHIRNNTFILISATINEVNVKCNKLNSCNTFSFPLAFQEV